MDVLITAQSAARLIILKWIDIRSACVQTIQDKSRHLAFALVPEFFHHVEK